MPPKRVKVTKCNVRPWVVIFLGGQSHTRVFSFAFLLCEFKSYNPETGEPDPEPCPRSSKVCWYIHPNEPEWDNRGKRLSSPPRGLAAGRRGSMSSRMGRGRGRNRTRSRSRSRSMDRGMTGRGRSRSRSWSSERYVSPSRRRPRRPSPPLRRPLHERIQRSRSPRRRSYSRSRPRNPSPPPHPRDRRQTTTPISSSRGLTPPRDTKLDNGPRRVKAESPTDTARTLSSRPTLSDTNTAAVGDRTPIPQRTSVDRNQQRLSLDLTTGEHTSNSIQQHSPQVDPLSPIFAPETPVIPGLSAAVQPAPSNNTSMTALQRSLEQVIRDQATTQTTDSSAITPGGGSVAPNPGTIPEAEKTEIWTTRVKCVDFVRLTKGISNTSFDKCPVQVMG